ncbi:Transposase and inactivated derivatives [uncultured Clostridium sp.]|nr:Transposase and inactivated derivatives [uncultured Clostridium sp.]
MALALSEEQLVKLNKKDVLQLLLESMAQEKELRSQIAVLTDELKRTNQQMQVILEKWNLAQANRFGRSSEKMGYDTGTCQQLELAVMYAECFNEAEATVNGTPPDEPDMEEVTVTAHKRKKHAGKREEDLKDLPHAEPVISTLTEEELLEQLGPGYRQLKDEVYQRLEFHPSSFEVKEYHICVYVSADGKKFAKAKRPQADLFRNSIATPSLLAGILNYKYVNALPVHRLAQDFKRSEVNISPQVMCNWVIKSSAIYFSLVYDWMKDVLLKQTVVQADETTLKVNRDGRKAGSSSYMWVYITGEHDDSGKKIVLYDYCRTRSTEHLREFLSSYKGILVSDGYQSYHTFSEEQSLTSAGCWTHCRRRFVNAIKAAKKDLPEEALKNSIAYQALARISAIYKLDGSWKERTSEYRMEHRQRILKPLVDEYFDWVKEQIKTCNVLPKSETGEGLSYSINQEKYLRAFLDNGDIPIDNSACERAIRPFCVGRKNWNVIDTVEGAQASAIVYSIAETANANNLKPYQYFEYLLTELPERISRKKDSTFSLDDLMPWSPKLPMSCRKIK